MYTDQVKNLFFLCFLETLTGDAKGAMQGRGAEGGPLSSQHNLGYGKLKCPYIDNDIKCYQSSLVLPSNMLVLVTKCKISIKFGYAVRGRANS